jgi:fructose-specific phosphotransferase system IIC component
MIRRKLTHAKTTVALFIGALAGYLYLALTEDPRIHGNASLFKAVYTGALLAPVQIANVLLQVGLVAFGAWIVATLILALWEDPTAK